MAKYLAEAVESVFAQDYPRMEYIVVDGGSTDGSLEILDRYQGRLSYTSGPDRGPSDAAFQGFRRAHGEILAWLNADDTYLPGAIGAAVEYLRAHPDVDVVYGEGWWIDDSGAIIGRMFMPVSNCSSSVMSMSSKVEKATSRVSPRISTGTK